MTNKIKLTRQTIEIKLENETTQKISAWAYDNSLAWHKGVSGQWTLTHIATGYKLADYHGKYSSIRDITKDISLISNWQTTCHHKLKSLARLCQNIIKEYA